MEPNSSGWISGGCYKMGFSGATCIATIDRAPSLTLWRSVQSSFDTELHRLDNRPLVEGLLHAEPRTS
ncbi:MAG: hypothetical protein U0930_26230 [Pirellulales bacterium]